MIRWDPGSRLSVEEVGQKRMTFAADLGGEGAPVCRGQLPRVRHWWPLGALTRLFGGGAMWCEEVRTICFSHIHQVNHAT